MEWVIVIVAGIAWEIWVWHSNRMHFRKLKKDMLNRQVEEMLRQDWRREKKVNKNDA